MLKILKIDGCSKKKIKTSLASCDKKMHKNLQNIYILK